jgi:alpha-mannosidase
MLKRPPVISAGTREDQASFLEIFPAGVVLSAARLLGNELELRLYETLGHRAEAVVHLPAAVAEARATNFLGESLVEPDQIKIDGRQIHTGIQPWKILTLRVKLR